MLHNKIPHYFPIPPAPHFLKGGNFFPEFHVYSFFAYLLLYSNYFFSHNTLFSVSCFSSSYKSNQLFTCLCSLFFCALNFIPYIQPCIFHSCHLFFFLWMYKIPLCIIMYLWMLLLMGKLLVSHFQLRQIGLPWTFWCISPGTHLSPGGLPGKVRLGHQYTHPGLHQITAFFFLMWL